MIMFIIIYYYILCYDYDYIFCYEITKIEFVQYISFHFGIEKRNRNKELIFSFLLKNNHL